jgi:glucosylceramidase
MQIKQNSCYYQVYKRRKKGDNTEKREDVFPKQLAVNDYMIQDPRYLQTYANYFCKFIDAYKEQGIPIDMVMYQNEAYSYTPYPGCAWTAEGTVRFNVEYLAPTLKKHHPKVKLYLGTFNTNRYDYVDKILSDPRMPQSIEGIGFQWEGGQILPKIRKKYPQGLSPLSQRVLFQKVYSSQPLPR